jgi:hypothetical protein
MSSFGTPPPPPPQPAYGGGGIQGAPPPNYLVWAILSTVLCGCTALLSLPLGIASIVYSTQVNSKWAMGDVAGAQAASEKAKKFAIFAAVLWVILSVISVILVAAGIVDLNSSGSLNNGS